MLSLKVRSLRLFSSVVFSGLVGMAVIVQAETPKIVLGEINSEIAKTLIPIQNNNTKAKMILSALKMNDLGVKLVKFESSVTKQSKKTLESVVMALSGSYWNPQTAAFDPETKINFSGKFNFLKAMTADEYNAGVQSLPELSKMLSEEAKSKYQEAVSTGSSILVNESKNGLTTKLVAAGFYKVELEKLPKNIKAEEVEFKGIEYKMTVTPESFSAEFKLISNPKYSAFQKDMVGLKELLEGLIRKDAAILKEVTALVRDLDSYADAVIEALDGGSSQNYFFN